MATTRHLIGNIPYVYRQDEPKTSKAGRDSSKASKPESAALRTQTGSARRSHIAIGSVETDPETARDDEHHVYECVHREKYVIYDENVRGAGVVSDKEFEPEDYQLVIKRLAREKWIGFDDQDIEEMGDKDFGDVFMQTLFGGIPFPPEHKQENFKLTFVADPKPVIPYTKHPEELINYTWDGTELFGEFVRENLLSLSEQGPNEWIVFREFNEIHVRDGRDIVYTLPWTIHTSIPSLTQPDNLELKTIWSGLDIINQLLPQERKISKTIWAAVPRYGSMDWLKISGLWRMKTFEKSDKDDAGAASDSLLQRYLFYRNFLWRIDDGYINLYPAGWNPRSTTYEQWHQALKDSGKGRYSDIAFSAKTDGNEEKRDSEESDEEDGEGNEDGNEDGTESEDDGDDTSSEENSEDSEPSTPSVDFEDEDRRQRILQRGDPGFAQGRALRQKRIIGLDEIPPVHRPEDIKKWDLQKRYVVDTKGNNEEETTTADDVSLPDPAETGKDPELAEMELSHFQGPGLATKAIVWKDSDKPPQWFKDALNELVLKPAGPAAPTPSSPQKQDKRQDAAGPPTQSGKSTSSKKSPPRPSPSVKPSAADSNSSLTAGQSQQAADTSRRSVTAQGRNSVPPGYSLPRLRSRSVSVPVAASEDKRQSANGQEGRSDKASTRGLAPSATRSSADTSKDAAGEEPALVSSTGSRTGQKRKNTSDVSKTRQPPGKKTKGPETASSQASSESDVDNSDGKNGSGSKHGQTRGRRNNQGHFKPSLPTIEGGNTPGDTPRGPTGSLPRPGQQETPTVRRPLNKPNSHNIAIKPLMGISQGRPLPRASVPTAETRHVSPFTQPANNNTLENQLDREARENRGAAPSAPGPVVPENDSRTSTQKGSSRNRRMTPTEGPQKPSQESPKKETQKQPVPDPASKGKKRGLPPPVKFVGKNPVAKKKTRQELENEKLAARLARAYPKQKNVKGEIEICSVCGADMNRISGAPTPAAKAEKREAHLDACKTDETLYCDSDAVWKKKQAAQAAQSGNDDNGSDDDNDDDGGDDGGDEGRPNKKQNNKKDAPDAKGTGKGRKEDEKANRLPRSEQSSQSRPQKRGAEPSPDAAKKRRKVSQSPSQVRRRTGPSIDVDKPGPADDEDDEDDEDGMEDAFDQALADLDNEDKPRESTVTPSPNKSDHFESDADEDTPEAERRWQEEKSAHKQRLRDQRAARRAAGGAVRVSAVGSPERAQHEAAAEAERRAQRKRSEDERQEAQEAALRKAKAKLEAEHRADLERLEAKRRDRAARGRVTPTPTSPSKDSSPISPFGFNERKLPSKHEENPTQTVSRKRRSPSSSESNKSATGRATDEDNAQQRDDETPSAEIDWNALFGDSPGDEEPGSPGKDTDESKQDPVTETPDKGKSPGRDSLKTPSLEDPEAGRPQPTPTLQGQQQDQGQKPTGPPDVPHPHNGQTSARPESPRRPPGDLPDTSNMPPNPTGETRKPTPPRTPTPPRSEWREDQVEEFVTSDDELPVGKRRPGWWLYGQWKTNPAFPGHERERSKWGQLTVAERTATKAYLDERDGIVLPGPTKEKKKVRPSNGPAPTPENIAQQEKRFKEADRNMQNRGQTHPANWEQFNNQKEAQRIFRETKAAEDAKEKEKTAEKQKKAAEDKVKAQDEAAALKDTNRKRKAEGLPPLPSKKQEAKEKKEKEAAEKAVQEVKQRAEKRARGIYVPNSPKADKPGKRRGPGRGRGGSEGQ